MSGCSVKPHNCPHSSAHQPLTQTRIPAARRPGIVSYSITRSIRGTQIPIVRDEPPSSRFPRFPPLEVFRRRPPMLRGTVRQRPASENLHKSGLMHRSKNSFHWITYRRAGRKAREPGSDTSSPGHAEGEPGLANISGTELTDGGEAGDFKGLRDPPLAPCFRTGAFLLAPRHRTYPRVGGPDPPPVIDDSALARGFSLRCSKMFSPLASHMSIR